jgi:hypothetical protein
MTCLDIRRGGGGGGGPPPLAEVTYATDGKDRHSGRTARVQRWYGDGGPFPEAGIDVTIIDADRPHDPRTIRLTTDDWHALQAAVAALSLRV